MDNTLLQRCYDALKAVDDYSHRPPGGATRARLRMELLDAIDEPGDFFETLSTRSDDDLLTARNKIDIELRKRFEVSVPTKLLSLGDDDTPASLSETRADRNERLVRQAINARDEHIERLLRDAGPGNAVGYRLDPQPPLYAMPDKQPASVELQWQFILVPLDENGNFPPVNNSEWLFVTLREWQA